MASVQELDQPTASHKLTKGLIPGRRFESILEHGFDPDRIVARGNRSLLDHVDRVMPKNQLGFAYRNGLWKSLRDDHSLPPNAEHDVVKILCARGAVLVGPPEPSATSTTARMPILEVRSGRQQKRLPWPWILVDERTDFADLDGLHALVLLSRLLGSSLPTGWGYRLSSLLFRSAMEFAKRHRYVGEQAVTWFWLLQHRMLSWPGPSSLLVQSPSPRRSRRLERDQQRTDTFVTYWERVVSPKHMPWFGQFDAQPLKSWFIEHASEIQQEFRVSEPYLDALDIFPPDMARFTPLRVPESLFVARPAIPLTPPPLSASPARGPCGLPVIHSSSTSTS